MRYLNAILLTVTLYSCATAQEAEIRPLDPRLTDYEYPYETHIHRIFSQEQSLEMVYMDIAPAEANGKTIVLLHGKNFNGAYWKTTIELLIAQGYRVIVPDQVGFGKSSKPQEYQFSFHELARNTRGLLDSLGVTESHVMGHSMGGMLAMRYALMYPEATSQLILLNPIGLEDWKRKVPYRPVSWWYANELKKDYDGIRKYQQESYYDGEWSPEYDQWVNLLAGWAKHPDYSQVAWNAALTYDMIFTQPVVYELELLQMPTLLLIGTRDRTALGKPLVSPEVRATLGLYDELGEQTAARIPEATLVEFPGIGHLPHIEAFDKYRKALLDNLK